jgi:hypothetical protein
VYLVHDLPVLGVSLVNRAPHVTLYSPPGQTYEAEYKTNLNASVPWLALGTVVATNQVTPLASLPNISGQLFLRLRALDPNSPRLLLMRGADQSWNLFITGKSGGTYKIQSRSLTGDATWHDEYTGAATSNTLKVPTFQRNDSGRIYRGIHEP